ncbi:hypothetical protein J1N09_05035 [Aureitalea sp. L0-47]|uniref:hypothetical protein n=1 Tax=Aureitalea sp. L0-47 TaxID=2816962 RepID=UPI002237080A|nr:hypothetical protein [Aureitalea sp. L0-47]MCW5519191.1 hypothetical protein [Aureitalea sp. L0-47]
MKYIYLHIPKNGGTTLQALLKQQYKSYQIFNIQDQDHKRNKCIKKLKEPQVCVIDYDLSRFQFGQNFLKLAQKIKNNTGL